ncbi:MAG TPA: hypothetical protein VFA33_24465 [Bryobacteraceae bacterium]|nr:hypothetical protein [Bryobacteraceae bacterium]
MRPIANIVAALGRIPRALTSPDPDVTRRPEGRAEPAGVGTALTLDLPDGWEYPPWADAEFWSPLDSRIKGEGPLQGAAVGTDALAWYASFHHGSGGDWGIFVPVSSLAYCEQRILGQQRGGRAWKWQIAYDFLLAHEQMHFAIDYVCAQWELLLEAPCWAAFLQRRKSGRISFLAAEEQLANAHMLRIAKTRFSTPVRSAIRQFVASQPAGYRDAPAATDQGPFDFVTAEVIKSYVGVHAIERGLNICGAECEHGRWLPSQADLSCCPVHIIHDEARLGLPSSALRFITSMPQIAESDKFLRELRRLDPTLQRRWAGLRQQMATGIPRSARLEKMKGDKADLFSIRLNDNFRVHLQMVQADNWEAVAVGSHKAMGHG